MGEVTTYLPRGVKVFINDHRSINVAAVIEQWNAAEDPYGKPTHAIVRVLRSGGSRTVPHYALREMTKHEQWELMIEYQQAVTRAAMAWADIGHWDTWMRLNEAAVEMLQHCCDLMEGK